MCLPKSAPRIPAPLRLFVGFPGAALRAAPASLDRELWQQCLAMKSRGPATTRLGRPAWSFEPRPASPAEDTTCREVGRPWCSPGPSPRTPLPGLAAVVGGLDQLAEPA